MSQMMMNRQMFFVSTVSVMPNLKRSTKSDSY